MRNAIKVLIPLGGGASTLPIAHWPLTETSGTAADNLYTTANGIYTNVTLNNTTFIDGTPAPLFVKASGSLVKWTAGTGATILTGLAGDEGSLMLWAKIATAAWEDGAIGYVCKFQIDGNNYFTIQKYSTNHLLMTYYKAGGTLETLSHYSDYTDWLQIVLTWSKRNDRARLYYNTDLVSETSGLGVWVGTTYDTTHSAIGAQTSSALNPIDANISNVIVWPREITQAEIDALFQDEFPTAKRLFFLGDSKTFNNYWPETLANGMTTATLTKYVELTPRFAVGGYDVANLDTYVTANLASVSGTPDAILANIGTNDARAVTITAEAVFKAEYNSMIATLQAKWPGVKIYLQNVYRSDSAQCITNIGIINGYIADIIAAGTGLYAGPNDAVWAEGGDAGATYLSADKVHYNAAGQAECAAQWVTILTA